MAEQVTNPHSRASKPDLPLLAEAIPEFARELESLLLADGYLELASQVSGLHVVERCRCGDDSCATFYTVPTPNGPWPALGDHGNLILNPHHGMLILDLVDGRIVNVEVLDRPDVRARLHEIVP